MAQVIGFGADWVVDGDLSIQVQGTSFPVSALLPTGAGFLGIVSDRKEIEMVVALSGAALFGMDEIRTANVGPEPGTVWLLVGALVGLTTRLSGLDRRGRARRGRSPATRRIRSA